LLSSFLLSSFWLGVLLVLVLNFIIFSNLTLILYFLFFPKLTWIALKVMIYTKSSHKSFHQSHKLHTHYHL
jgi:hypothetical protein